MHAQRHSYFQGHSVWCFNSGQEPIYAATEAGAVTGIRIALWFGEVSPYAPRNGWHSDENAFMFQWNDGVPGEDCLRINLWTPVSMTIKSNR